MNLKYYLRGLGIGVTVTALILGIALGSGKESMSNEEIKERAKALGMVEGTMTVAEAAAVQETEKEPVILDEEKVVVQESAGLEEKTAEEAKETEDPKAESEETKETQDSEAESEGAQETQDPEMESEEADPDPQAEKEDAQEVMEPAEEPEQKAEPTEEPVTEAMQEEDSSGENMVSFVVNHGEGSMTICKRLKEVGLIEDAAEFDAYLCQNGYSTRLRAGEYRILADAGWEEILSLLCN